MDYIVKLDIDDLTEEDFHKDDNNLAEVSVYNKKGENIAKECRVQITLTKNGLIGLGKELIRLAYHFKDGKHYHIEPINNGNICETLGIVLKPESSELIITCGDYKNKISEYK